MHTILVVDDYPSVREVVRSMQESRGYIGVLARDGEAALAGLAVALGWGKRAGHLR